MLIANKFTGGKPLLKLNRILRPGGVFIWSATPVYRDDERDKKVWECVYTNCAKLVFFHVVSLINCYPKFFLLKFLQP